VRPVAFGWSNKVFHIAEHAKEGTEVNRKRHFRFSLQFLAKSNQEMIMGKPKIKRKESEESMVQRSMALDIFDRALDAYQGVEPVVSLSYDDYSIYISLHDTLPALREEIKADKREMIAFGNRGMFITIKEWEDRFNRLDLSDRSLIADSTIMKRLCDLPEEDRRLQEPDADR
jgi:hypothetical protein